MGVTLSAGGSLTWWAENVVGAEIADLVAEAEQVPPGAEGLLFAPYLSGERTPLLDPHARGAFIGLTARHSRPHMTRAVMEGVVLSLRESLEIMHGLGVDVKQIRATGGGARSGLWRSLQADIYGLPVYRTTVEEGPAYGSALLGGVAAGVYRDIGEASSQVTLRQEVMEPKPQNESLYRECFEVYRSLYSHNRDAMHRLTEFAGGMENYSMAEEDV